MGKPAQDRARGKDQDRGHEHPPCPELVRHPATDRHEHGKREQIAGDRQIEPDRVLAERRRHRGQRGRDDRAVELVHELGGADDEGNEDDGTEHGRDMEPGQEHGSYCTAPSDAIANWVVSGAKSAGPTRTMP